MDPSMLNLLEEDEDETMHSAADVDAFTDSQEACIMRGANQQRLAVGINDEQPMTSEMRNQLLFSSELSSQQAMHMRGANQQAINSSNRGKKVPFFELLPVIQSLLIGDKSRSMQLQILCQTFQRKEITKEAFVRQMRSIVGDRMINKAGYKLQRQARRDAAARQHMQEPSIVPAESSDFTLDNDALQQYEVFRQGDSHNMQAFQMSSSYFSASSQDREHPTYPVQRFSIQQQQHLHFPQASCNTFRSTGNNYHPFPTSEFITSVGSLKQAHDPQMGQLPVHHVPSAPSCIAAANSARTVIEKTSLGQKKPLEALGSSPSPLSKKLKVSGGAVLDKNIEQLNDFTAVCGVNLREEEEQLLSWPKEGGQVSEASRRVMQEEEDRLILQKIPLQKKLAQIMAKSGLKSIGSDVEKCLSWCVRERIRGLMSSLIKLSKQRVDIEKPRHKTFITTDVREKIMAKNRKVRVGWEKKQTEEENFPESSTALDGDKEKDESRARPVKVTEEDVKMRTTAANVAARAAVGGDDIFSKWQLLAEQARRKLEGGTDGSSGSQAGKDVSQKTLTGKGERDHYEAEKRGQSSSTPGSIRKLGRNQVIMAHNRVARTISVKDVIGVLEREAQMSRSALMYRLYDEIHSESSIHLAN